MNGSPKNDCAPAAANGRNAGYVKGLHVDSANPEVLLQRLDGVQKTSNGWRARCPACGGSSRKLSVAVSDNRVLAHCFSMRHCVERVQIAAIWAPFA